MPIKHENRALYPRNWKAEIVPRILKRAGYRCEQCRVPHHAVGYRDAEGCFVPLAGNGPCDAAGQGKTWPGYELLSYAEAAFTAEVQNDHIEGKRRVDGDGNHWFVVILTVAHTHGSDLDCPDSQLRALCQKCHNTYDAPMRRRNTSATLKAKRQAIQPALEIAA